MWASTHNDTLKEKMSAVVFALSGYQNKIETWYLTAFPSELFDRLEAIQPVWEPYYTIHKICITTSTSTGLEQIMPWLFYHKVIGVSAFILFVEGKVVSSNVSKILESIPVTISNFLVVIRDPTGVYKRRKGWRLFGNKP